MRSTVVWIAVTVVGYAVGMAVSVLLVGPIARPLGPVLGGLVSVAVFGAGIGLGVGALQFIALPRAAARLGAWLLATVIGTGAGFALASLVGETAGNVIPYTAGLIVGGGTIQGVAGAMVGLGVGSAQWLVLPALGRRWIVATVVGLGLGYAAAAGALEFFDLAVLTANLPTSFGAIVGIFTGIAQALVLRSRPRP